ncbi:hypothetical protein DL93DRAFT_459726 [Clavulina sp. PMI_390]|nr:hypothetical protein DL93DRAFT_459726 [Clavulina sp. PMI_390]
MRLCVNDPTSMNSEKYGEISRIGAGSKTTRSSASNKFGRRRIRPRGCAWRFVDVDERDPKGNTHKGNGVGGSHTFEASWKGHAFGARHSTQNPSSRSALFLDSPPASPLPLPFIPIPLHSVLQYHTIMALTGRNSAGKKVSLLNDSGVKSRACERCRERHEVCIQPPLVLVLFCLPPNPRRALMPLSITAMLTGKESSNVSRVRDRRSSLSGLSPADLRRVLQEQEGPSRCLPSLPLLLKLTLSIGPYSLLPHARPPFALLLVSFRFPHQKCVYDGEGSCRACSENGAVCLARNRFAAPQQEAYYEV